MANINYLRSVSPLFNAASAIAGGEQLFGALHGQRRSSAPLGGGQAAAPAQGGGLQRTVGAISTQPEPSGNMSGQVQTSPLGSPTQYRPPTGVYQGKGKGFREATQEDRSQYNQQWLGDRRNQGYGAGQVDPGLARAAIKKESSNEEKSGGK